MLKENKKYQYLVNFIYIPQKIQQNTNQDYLIFFCNIIQQYLIQTIYIDVGVDYVQFEFKKNAQNYFSKLKFVLKLIKNNLIRLFQQRVSIQNLITQSFIVPIKTENKKRKIGEKFGEYNDFMNSRTINQFGLA
ncbi:unnamed protein product [Paramecium sonneborni]|uniref:Uncharacterized protein n=1 Tax=Paramecium sonneborni TaxID=65129 RepID=A0A8S1QP41_9CILI|nr:unnamed protein product [Paramecium sonneborni]